MDEVEIRQGTAVGSGKQEVVTASLPLIAFRKLIRLSFQDAPVHIV
jgi:hypothetical protein